MSLLKFFLCLGAFSLVSGQLILTVKPNYNTLQATLNANRAKWETKASCQYEMTISRQCFCFPDYLGPFDVNVVNGEIVGVVPNNEYTDDLPTVDGLFDIIQDAIDQKAAQITVTYNSQYGYPKSVYIDYKAKIADDEIGYTVSVKLSNQPCKTCEVDLDFNYAFNALKTPKNNGFKLQEFIKAISRWEFYLLSVNCNYTYKLGRSCFCVFPDFTGPFIIDVAHEKVVNAKFETPTPSSKVPDDLPTVTELFKIIFDEAQKADKVDIEYDPKTGAPTKAFIDRIKLAIDDEITYSAEIL